MMLTSGGGDGLPSSQVVSILKPAALAFLEIESSILKPENEENVLDFPIDISNVEFDFLLSQKPYALTINALSTLAINRPDFFKEVATVIARRTANPPTVSHSSALDKSGVIAVTSNLKSTCLTLLRNPLSVTSDTTTILSKALQKFDMDVQAEKALAMAKQAISLLSAGRAARNRANMFYEWDASETDRRSTKRQRETDDALAKMRAAKIARGLGSGIQLPTNMSDAVDLIMLNLTHLPKKHPGAGQLSATSKSRKTPITLDFVVDAIMTNGASLIQEEGRWYDRDGGSTWSIDLKSDCTYELAPKFLETMNYSSEKQLKSDDDEAEEAKIKRRNLLFEQCNTAAADSLGRILNTASHSKSKVVKDLCHKLAARLSFTLESAKPSAALQASYAFVKASVEKAENDPDKASLMEFIDKYPLVSTSLSLDANTPLDPADFSHSDSSLNSRILNEAMAQTSVPDEVWKYDNSLLTFVASVVHASDLANEKFNDSEKKRSAANALANLQKTFVTLPRLTKRSLILLSRICNVEEITKKSNETSRKSTTQQESVAVAAAAHAAKVAAEKRATSVLLILRDIAFQRDTVDIRKSAVQCAISIATGHIPSSTSIQDKALKLTMNVLFTRNEALSNMVVDCAIEDFEHAAAFAIEQYDHIKEANKAAEGKEDNNSSSIKNPLAPRSEEEKKVIDQMRKHAVLIMAVSSSCSSGIWNCFCSFLGSLSHFDIFVAFLFVPVLAFVSFVYVEPT